jgi:hypothetical protein
LFALSRPLDHDLQFTVRRSTLSGNAGALVRHTFEDPRTVFEDTLIVQDLGGHALFDHPAFAEDPAAEGTVTFNRCTLDITGLAPGAALFAGGTVDVLMNSSIVISPEAELLVPPDGSTELAAAYSWFDTGIDGFPADHFTGVAVEAGAIWFDEGYRFTERLHPSIDRGVDGDQRRRTGRRPGLGPGVPRAGGHGRVRALLLAAR